MVRTSGLFDLERSYKEHLMIAIWIVLALFAVGDTATGLAFAPPAPSAAALSEVAP